MNRIGGQRTPHPLTIAFERVRSTVMAEIDCRREDYWLQMGLLEGKRSGLRIGVGEGNG